MAETTKRMEKERIVALEKRSAEQDSQIAALGEAITAIQLQVCNVQADLDCVSDGPKERA